LNIHKGGYQIILIDDAGRGCPGQYFAKDAVRVCHSIIVKQILEINRKNDALRRRNESGRGAVHTPREHGFGE
jgi:hypothetical protein